MGKNSDSAFWETQELPVPGGFLLRTVGSFSTRYRRETRATITEVNLREDMWYSQISVFE